MRDTIDCGGCRNLGAHKRWCPTTVGPQAALLGPIAEQVEHIADRPSRHSNQLYHLAAQLTDRALAMRDDWLADNLALGQVQDNPQTLLNLHDYLTRQNHAPR